MRKDKKLIIVGDSAFAEIAYEYFTCDSRYEVAAFAVEQAYLKRDRLFDRPVVPLEGLAERFSPQSHDVYVAVSYTQLNRLRTRLMGTAKQAGYTLASYVSSHAFVWRNVKLGEHCFIFEHNVLQPFVSLGDNVVLWSGNHIGHHTVIGDNVFVTSHVAIGGFCEIGANSVISGSIVIHNTKVGSDCWINPGVVISKDTKDRQIFRSPKSEIATVDAPRFFKVKE
jgi:sugar O-acyltransferase (sialic acid O-acetyltransferase NeuD family)